MHNIKKEAPNVAQGFFELVNSVKQYSPLDDKINELIKVGIFVAIGGMSGIAVHGERAMKAGATQEEILAAILLALPIVGITNVTLAFDKALEVIEAHKEFNNSNEKAEAANP